VSSHQADAPPAPLRWGIVGGGMLGMTLALRLARAGHEVVLYEGAPVLGGLASTWQLGPVRWDRHYHVTLMSDTWLRTLLAELNLEDDLRWVETKTGCYSDGRLYSVSNTVEFLRFPALGIVDKIRLGATIFYASKIRDWERLEGIHVEDWLIRWSGRRTFERFWLPLLRAKLGDNYRQTSAAFIWAVIQRLYAARRSGMKQEMFGYVAGGYARILARFGQVVGELADVRLDSRVSRIAAGASGITVTQSDGTDELFDRVAVTAPAPVAARIVEGLTEAEIARLRGIDYQGIVCASLLLTRPLADYYVTNITDAGIPFTGVIEMTALVDPQEFGGHSLVYLPRYVTADDEFLTLDDDEVAEQFLAALERMYPHFDRGDVVAFQLSRVRHVLPIPRLHYSRDVPPITTSVPGVFLVNSTQIVNGTLNVNETVQLAERAAGMFGAGASVRGRPHVAGTVQ
jgi:protoporphyrinogen oxidase